MLNKKLEGKEIALGVIAIFLIISMFVFLAENVLIAILMGILGILLLPDVNSKINEKIIKGNKVKNYIKIALEVILFLFISFNLPSIDNSDIQEVAENNNTNTAQATNEINKIEEQNVTENNTEIGESNTNYENTIVSNITSSEEVENNNKQNIPNNEQTNGNSSTSNSSNKSVQSTGSSSSSKATTSSGKSTGTTSSKSSGSHSSSGTSSGSTSSGGSSASTSSTSTSTSAPVTNGQTVYVTPTGKRYHLKASCAGKNATASTLSKAKARGLTPCKKCAQ